MADIAAERVALMPDLSLANKDNYFMEMAYKQGQIAIIQHILDSSIASETVMATQPQQ